ncbi:dUTP diphosphatase [Helcococcus massiliensis]|uniref:dUTP diphosphatase n=1 Tax=Helcococcus massiliensis TaxID=2040290 RepID=UPI00190E5E33|nr:dUTP diphosphatase [Helcococcus massiliensis]
MKLKMMTEKFKPAYATEGSAGFDLYCNNKEPIVVGPNEVAKVPTGIRVSIPKGYFGAVYPRSSTGIKHRITLANTVGIIDSDYRGDIQIFFVNNSDKPYTIEHGERLAQMVIQPYVKVDIELVDSLDETERGEGGIGSTGK